jgi:hypothetical protein
MSSYYGAAIRGARYLVRLVPTGWPPPIRITVKVLLAIVGVAFVTVAWILTTALLLITNLAGGLGRGSGNPRL